MELNIAKETIEKLADGINPATGEVLPKEGPYNDPLVVRALFTILESIKAIRPAARTAEQRQNDDNDKGDNSIAPLCAVVCLVPRLPDAHIN